MTVYLQMTIYESNTALAKSDQITVPASVWEELDSDAAGPIYVQVGEEGTVIGRIIPATPSDALAADTCRIPEWMWMRMGAPESETWLALRVTATPPTVDRLVLRAQKEAMLLALGDPVQVLTACLSGAGGSPSWSCLTEGMELPLECGSFDVVALHTEDGSSLQHGSILDTDVKLEFVPALDYVEPVPVERSSTPVPQIPSPYRSVAGVPRGFIPFSGTGRRLGSK
jgi:hypothetical protein